MKGNPQIAEAGKMTRFTSENNPRHGRPKGVKNKATIAKMVLALPVKYQDENGDEKAGTIEEAMYAAQVRKAINKGDTLAFMAVLDNAYGKSRQALEAPDAPQVEYNYDNLTEEELTQLAALQAKAAGRNPDGSLINRQGAEEAEIVD